MTEQKKLRELQNNLRIVGTVKSVDLDIKPNKKDPSVMQIMGSITVLVEDKANNRAHEHEVKLFAKHTAKTYKGYVTLKNDLKAIDVVGKDLADRVSVVGNVSENIYVPADGKLREFNNNRGAFFNRVDADALAKDPTLANDSAVAQMELVVINTRPKTDKDGIETGEYAIEAFTTDYSGGVHMIHDIVVGVDLADVITEHYENDLTGKLTFALNNYVELSEEEPPEDPFAGEDGFGVQVDLSNGPIKNYIRELRVIGGFPPYFDDRAMSEEDIKFAKQIHALKVQEIKNNVPSAPPAAAGPAFGNDPFAAPQPGGPIEISDDDLPF